MVRAIKLRSGPRKGAYVWQRLMKSGAIIGNGTDAPVEDVDPIANYYAAVTRKDAAGRVFCHHRWDDPIRSA